jgi:hypothetical protein
MKFEPVHLPEDRGLNGRASQTLIRKYAMCPRSAYLYQLFKGEASSAAMVRGRGFHLIAERSIRAAMEQGEATIPPEVVKAIANEVFAEEHVPFDEHDAVREMAYRWGSEIAVDPGAVVALETLFTLELAGWQVRCRIDFAEVTRGGATVVVRDWKTSKAAVPYDEIARKRPDGSLSAKNAQLVLYALALAFGVPVRVEECVMCQGTGRLLMDECGLCGGAGHTETPEPFPVAGRAQSFELSFVYPAIEDKDGKMLTRDVTLTRLELEEYRASLEATLVRLGESERTGDWPAIQSDAACSECPASSLCPIPTELRDHRGTINSVEQAREAAEVLDRRDAINAAVRKEIKAFAKAHETPIRYGADKVLEFGYTESERIADKDAMWADMDRAVRFGEPFDRARYVKVVKSTPFRQRTLSADELAEEAIGGSNE